MGGWGEVDWIFNGEREEFTKKVRMKGRCYGRE